MKRLCLPVLIALILTIYPSAIFAWWEHSLITYSAAGSIEQLQKEVTVESLESFVKAEQSGLETLLRELDRKNRSNPEYPPLPESLQFKANNGQPALAFLRALRINPTIKLAMAVQEVPGKIPGNCHRIPHTEVTILKDADYMKEITFCAYRTGDRVQALLVLSSASDEPDYGHDIGLFEDNHTEFGKEYGFGEQSFGNAKLEYSSQAPFHMGFYHESAVVYTLAGFLKQTYADYRAREFLALARFAFKTGHPYWGYRFLGWGLHYLQDLTQPYHARVMPAKGTTGLVWMNLLNTVGISSPQTEAIQQLSNRHLALENFQRNLMIAVYQQKRKPGAMWKALTDLQLDDSYDPAANGYIRQIVAGEAASSASEVDSILEQQLPESIATDGNYVYKGVGAEDDIYAMLEKKGTTNTLVNALTPVFQRVGAHTRNYIRLGLSQE
ncbi:MAG: phospholipase [Leptospiraceae bacterium]|nr:phospholipase [Leptospiraceae bacterium]